VNKIINMSNNTWLDINPYGNYAYHKGYVRIAYCDDVAEFRYDFGINRKGKIDKFGGESNIDLDALIEKYNLKNEVLKILDVEEPHKKSFWCYLWLHSYKPNRFGSLVCVQCGYDSGKIRVNGFV